jgi:phosphate transport system ATP-binding protein
MKKHTMADAQHSRTRSTPDESEADAVLEARNLSIATSQRALLRGINLRIPPRSVFGIIGPSGAGKSTLLRCLNRLIDLDPHLRREGDVLFHGSSIFARDVDPDALRARVGMLFQQPVIFPGSIEKNVLFGAIRHRRLGRRAREEIVEGALRDAALWDEVKDRLGERAAQLSVGQQQRLCLARTLAVQPEVILMDEPTSALDVKSTEAIERTIQVVSQTRSVVLVTHNIGQAERLANRVAQIGIRGNAGEVLRAGLCREVLAGLDGSEERDGSAPRQRSP